MFTIMDLSGSCECLQTRRPLDLRWTASTGQFVRRNSIVLDAVAPVEAAAAELSGTRTQHGGALLLGAIATNVRRLAPCKRQPALRA